MADITPSLEGSLPVSGPYRHSSIEWDEVEGQLIVTLPEQISQFDADNTKVHVTVGGEFLHGIVVSAYYRVMHNPLELIDFIAQFQSPPIIDLGEPLDPGTEILLPSPMALEEIVYGESMSDAPEV